MIPAMTDPMGAYWHQPADIREAPMDDKLVLLTPRQFEGLPEYSTSQPSGVYPGKCWRRQEYERGPDNRPRPTGRWFLAWYGDEFEKDGKKFVSNNYRQIEVVH